MPDQYQGQSLSRLEDSRFLTGRGTYVANAIPPGCLHLHVLRSPHGHARIDRLDIGAARTLPGVVAIYTEADLAADGIGPLPCAAAIEFVEKLIVPPRPALAKDIVRHVGDPVACIIAQSIEAALEAAEAIEVDYTPLPAVVDAAAALAPDAPLLWPQVPGNSAYLYRRGNKEAVDQAMAAAKHIVTADLLNSRVVVAPIETRAAIATYDAAQDLMHLTLTGQGVHGIRRQLAEAVFRIPQDRLRVSAPDVGGGFGMKNFVYPEWVHLLFAARKLGRPVRWVSERVEDFVTSAQGRDFRARARLALDDAGRFLALDVQAVANMGAYLSGAGPGSSTVSAGNAMGGVYAIPAVAMEVRGAFTNTPPIDAYRGAGKPEANYLIERLVDQAAREAGIDAVELRRRNLISSFPHRTPTGMQIDGGRFVANLDDALRVADQQGFEARRKRSAEAGKLRGWGLACFLETARGAPGEVARVSFDADGRVSLAVGTMSNGQGHETTYPQVAADLLGLPITAFRYHQGDTDLLPSGNGHGGARSMQMGGTALVMAIEAILEKARRIAAHLLQAPVEGVRFLDGRFVVDGTDRAIALLDVAAASRDAANLPEGVTPGLDTLANNPSDRFGFPNGCHVAEVEIDPETGAVRLDRYTLVDDYGRLLNPMLTLGQVHGGLAQGIGQAMLEHTVFDPDSGQMLSASFMDYALPRADDLPSFAGHLDASVPTQSNALGVKGAGQAGCMSAPQTIMSAILDALRPLGVTHLDMPATPLAVWQAIQAARP
ncbi:MAG: xanthine dehydrogenase family protein molybdopterin-binding subunit [Reyranellaceae bacterium]